MAFAVSLAVIPAPAAAQDKSLTIFAAASMKNALDEIDAAYTAKTGVRITVSYAASSPTAGRMSTGHELTKYENTAIPSIAMMCVSLIFAALG